MYCAMMSKIRKMQDTWVAKSIFILTALSFMSLFGISGYVNSAGKNRAVIKVDDIELSQAELSYLYEKDLNNARKMFGDALEVNDNVRNALMLGIVNRELSNAIIQKNAQKNNIVIGDDLVRKIIYSQSEFMDGQGRFDKYRFNSMLSATGWSEADYIKALRLDIERQMLVQNPVNRIHIPAFLTDLLGKIENQQRVFSYVKIFPENLKLTRSISDDELQQYYQDFSENFMAPEARDIAYVAISSDEIAQRYEPSQDEINAYMQQHADLFHTPEKRNVLQMVFDDEDSAQQAMQKISQGDDFVNVAKNLAQQSAQDTNLGNVSKDMLLPEIADDVFSAPVNKVVGPLKSEFGWHVLKVAKIIPASDMDKKLAFKKAADNIKQEKAYDIAYDFSNQIEDKIGAGASFDDIVKELNLNVHQVKGLTEDGKSVSQAKISQDIVDAAFSYNVGEVSQVIETDTGYALVKVNNIVESHLLPIDAVKSQIIDIWAANEREAMAQELVNDVMNDLSNGENIKNVAQRLGLKALTSKPIKKSESFEMLPSSQIAALFQESVGTPVALDVDEGKIIAVTSELVKYNHKLSNQDKADIQNQFQNQLADETAKVLVDGYAQEYDVRVKYKLLGLAD